MGRDDRFSLPVPTSNPTLYPLAPLLLWTFSLRHGAQRCHIIGLYAAHYNDPTFALMPAIPMSNHLALSGVS